jgi:LPPG:FO 2-phospho-L-lactate transferase
MLDAGYPLSAVTEALCARWQPGVRLIPMTDDRVETHVVVDGEETGTRRALHFQEWWIRYRASLPAHGFVVVGIDDARPGPDVVPAILDAELVLLPPSNPVVSIGTILQVPGIADAVRDTRAPVVAVSPIVGGAPVRGMADACLAAIGVETSALAVARHYGARSRGGLIDAWLVDTSDADCVAEAAAMGLHAVAVPAMMTDVDATAALARECLDAAARARR